MTARVVAYLVVGGCSAPVVSAGGLVIEALGKVRGAKRLVDEIIAAAP